VHSDNGLEVAFLNICSSCFQEAVKPQDAYSEACSVVGLGRAAQQQEEGRGPLEQAGLPGNDHRGMVTHRA
jgi:hypothetical protein